MEIKKYESPTKITQVTAVTLEKGEGFTRGKYSSRGPGHVLIVETPQYETIDEFNLNSDKFKNAIAKFEERFTRVN